MRFLILLLTIVCAISFFVDDAIAQSIHNKELTDEIFPRTDPEIIGLIYQMLKVIDLLFIKHDISYWIDAGTALGALRHQGCIPWDDDADLVFKIKDQQRILALQDEIADYGFYLRQYRQGILRLYPSKSKKYPFIDLSGYILCDDNTYRYYFKWSRLYFDRFFWLPQEVDILVRVPFGPLMLNAPNDMMRYVLNGYGNDSLSHATFQKHHGGNNNNTDIKEKVRIVDFSPANYKITNFNILLD